MKTNAITVCLITLLPSLAGGVPAQTLTTLASFNDADGASPQATLVASGSLLYGTTYGGGSQGYGTVFSVNTNGGGIVTLYSFYGAVYNTNTSNYVTTDGANPACGLVLSGNTLYGTTFNGGTSDDGTVFQINATNSAEYFILHSFTGGNGGANPDAGLVLSGNTLYGTTFLGGTASLGSVFRINVNGTDFTNIYSFKGGTNGSNPEASLTLSGNTLYGTTYGAFNGLGSGYGTVFRVNIDGSGFSNVYTFTDGSDGANPEAGVLLSGGTLYGTASAGGDFFGTVFKVNTNGSGFSSYAFDGTVGANPQAGLILAGNTLYGTTPNGGNPGWGAVFQINTDGSDFTSIYAFTDGSDGASPEAGLLLLGGTLYGTTQADDSYGYYGTVFALPGPAASIPLNISSQGGKVTLSWNGSTFSLQAATSLTGPYTNVPSASSPFTTNVTGGQLFFRLKND